MPIQPYYNTEREWENYIQEVRVERGLSTTQLARLAKTTQSSITQLAHGLISPIYQVKHGRYNAGEIKPWVERICIVLDVKPEYIFPREICPLEDPKLKKLVQWQVNEILLSSYSQQEIHSIVNRRNQRKFIWRYMVRKYWFRKDHNTVQYPNAYRRMIKVLQYRFICDMSLDQIAEKFEVTRMRIRQIEAKGLNLMRKPFFARQLKREIEI